METPDIIKYKDVLIRIQPYILTPYFEKYPERRTKLVNRNFLISNHKRRYWAYFEINGKDLEIYDLVVRITPDERESQFKELFPKAVDQKIHWFDGIILIGIGKSQHYRYAYYHDYFYRHEKFLKEHNDFFILEFKGGKLTKELTFTKDEFNLFMLSQLENFKLTNQYGEERKKIIKMINRRHEVRHKIWEFNENDIEQILLNKFLWFNKELTEK